MAVEVLPDSPSAAMSPRISFSHDLRNDVVPVEHYVRSSSSSSTDFDFCVFRESFDHEYPSSADELFSDGKILPIKIKRRLAPPVRSSAASAAPPPLPPPPPPPKLTAEEKQNSKTTSFWRFKRSASLNCGSGYARTLCPLPILSRSNSTGSTASVNAVKRSSSSNNQKQSNIQKYSLPNSALKQSPSTNYHKPPLKKGGYCSYNGGVKINPVLNVPSANLFGLSSLFSGGKDKGKKK